MDQDDDDFFAYQTAKSLRNKRSQLKQFLEAPTISKRCSSSSDSESEIENENDSKSKRTNSNLSIEKSIESKKISSKESNVESKDLIKNKIQAIVNSCLTSETKSTRRKIKLGKRTAADDFQDEQEDNFVNQLSQQTGKKTKNFPQSFLDRSQLEEEEERVTRETAAYNRLDAVLRLTQPICEKSNPFEDNFNDEDQINTDDDD